ncbi:MAG: DNA-directed RNA polymerase subunit alpha [Dehalococcoidia bacterium]
MLDTYILPTGSTEGAPESLKPDIHVLEADDTYARVAVEPLQRGYGITVGNPLRRILLSSIKGSAITWVKIESVVHEYTAIPGVKEEVMDLLMNVKRIRIHSQSERTGKMRLEVSGEGRVCAGDISTSADFEIINPELHLATLDSENSSLSIEFNVEPGVGYQPAVQSEGVTGLPVGVLPVDAIFNPVRKVDYAVERTRVGQVTDYERLVLEVWTDGTIAPRDAIKEAAETLVNHFFLFSNLNPNGENPPDRPSLTVTPEVYQTPIERLDLSPRTLNCLKRAHITKVGEVLEMSDDELLKIRNFGDKSLEELREKLVERGITAPGKEPGEGIAEEDAVSAMASLSSQDIGELMAAGDAPIIGVMATDDDSPVEELVNWPGLGEEDDEEDHQ